MGRDLYPGGTYLNQSAQLGFGKPTAALVLDQTFDQVWGLVVVGGVGAWRGGENKLNSYRAPTASLYGYTGYFLGPFVPSFGFVLSGYRGHDVDRNSRADHAAREPVGAGWARVVLRLARADGRGNASRTSTTASTSTNRVCRDPWGFMPWTVSFGVSAAPF